VSRHSQEIEAHINTAGALLTTDRPRDSPEARLTTVADRFQRPRLVYCQSKGGGWRGQAFSCSQEKALLLAELRKSSEMLTYRVNSCESGSAKCEFLL